MDSSCSQPRTTRSTRSNNVDEYGEVQSQPRETAIFWQPADNNELGTRNRINEYLRFEPTRIHPITKQPGSARLFFVREAPEYPNGIRHLIRETRAQRRLKVAVDDGRAVYSDERDENVSDHSYDCLRYAVASRSSPPPADREPTTGTFAGARRGVRLATQAITIR